MEVEHGNHGVQRVPKAFHGPPKKPSVNQSLFFLAVSMKVGPLNSFV